MIDFQDSYQLAYVVNIGDSPLEFPVPGYDKSGNQRKAHIKPGEKQLMPFDTIASAFGHPLARNLSHKDRSREELYQALQVYWGYHIGFDVETNDQLTEDKIRQGLSSWDQKCPKFRVETVEGEWIPMVLDDPDGTAPLPDDAGAVDPQQAINSKNTAVMERALAAIAERDRERDAVVKQLLDKLAAMGADTSDIEADQTVPSNFSSEKAPAQSSELPPVPADEPPPKTDRPRAVRASRSE